MADARLIWLAKWAFAIVRPAFSQIQLFNLGQNAMRVANRLYLALAVGCVLVGIWGCAGKKFGRTIWGSAPPDTVAGVKPPSDRIKELKELSEKAPNVSPDEHQRWSSDLAQQIKTEQDPLVRVQIVRTLSVLKTPLSAAVLQAALGDTDADVRIACCDAWGTRGGAEAVQELGKVLTTDTNVDVRLAAARNMGHTKDASAITALADALSDSDPAMQRRAIESLRLLSDKDFGSDVSAWQQYAKSERPRLKEPSLAERFRKLF